MRRDLKIFFSSLYGKVCIVALQFDARFLPSPKKWLYRTAPNAAETNTETKVSATSVWRAAQNKCMMKPASDILNCICVVDRGGPVLT